MRIAKCVAVCALGCVCAADGDENGWRDALATVKTRLTAEAAKGRPDLKQAHIWLRDQKPDGSWGDILYDAKNRSIWPPMTHLTRLHVFAKAYASAKTPAAERDAFGQAFTRGFDYWITRDPTSSNWWQKEIGAPRSLSHSMLLTEPLLTGGRLEKGCGRLARAKLGMTGQNLVWLAENTIGRGCLQGDAAVVAEAFRRMEAEIVVTLKEGIQPDFSFHQHGAQLYSGGYGNGFASSSVRFAKLAHGTAFAFAPEKIRIIERYLLDGQQWMMRGQQFDYSACGRELTRPNNGRIGGYASTARTLSQCGAVTRADELERFAARIQKGITPATPALTGHRHFWRSDYTAHHTPAWMVSVRMTSNRLLQTEIINEENQLGEHLSDGVTFLYRSGEEYRNIFPVWDWARLPGITVEHDRPLRRIQNRRRGARAFAGGVSDGTDGVSAMDFERDGLTARKAWFFVGDTLVCLGAGITSTNGYNVITSVNQCLAADSHTVMDKTPSSAHGIYHDGIGYLFLDPEQTVQARRETQTGDWKRISTPRSADPVSRDVFSTWIDHGRQPKDARYAYVITPQRDMTALAAFAAAAPLRVMANTTRIQAVEQTDGQLLQAVFYEAASFESAAWGTVAVDTPCLLMLRKESKTVTATVCNPANKDGRVRIQACGQTREATFPAGEQAGASVRLKLL